MAMCLFWIGRRFHFPTDVGNGTLQSPHQPQKKKKKKEKRKRGLSWDQTEKIIILKKKKDNEK